MRTTLKKDEKVLLITRHHWLKLVMPFLIWTLIGVISVLFFNASIALTCIFISSIYPIWSYFNWVHNVWVVTNLRIIDEEGFLTRHAKESPLEKINNIEYSQSFSGRIFGYGNVDIQTAAEMGDTSYIMIHHPKLLKDTITHAQEAYKLARESNQAQLLAKAIAENSGPRPSQALIADELNKLFELVQKGAITQEEFIAQKNKLMGS